MSTTIPQRDLRNHNAQIIERVLAGESFVVTRGGVPVAEVVAYHGDQPPTFVPTDALAGATSPTRGWLSDIRALDQAVEDEQRDPWLAPHDA